MAEIFIGCTGSIESAHKFVVIKRILLIHSHSEEFNKMFQNEGKIAVNINHSNICSIYEFGVVKGQFFICMEYISGRNVRQLVKKLKGQKKSLSVAMCVHIVRSVCNGLDYAHSCTDSVTGQPLNIIHRDISPQNIMVGFSGDVKIIDFGIAKIDDSEATKVGVLKGKFEYMSPEQARGRVLDRQTDIFSLGAVLWELLAGRKLFSGSNEMKLLKKIRDCQIPDLKKINPYVHDTLVEIVNKSLNPNKNLRYKNAASMGNALSVFLNKAYPDFTPTHFSSLIREVYVEEILEERQKLKAHSQDLAQDNKTKVRQRGKKAKSFDNAPASTFREYKEDHTIDSKGDSEYPLIQTSTNPSPNSSSPSSQGGSYTATETEQGGSETSQQKDLTKTEFDDNLDENNSIFISSDGRSNVVTFGKKSDGTGSYSEYKPWEQSSLKSRTSLSHSALHKKKKKEIYLSNNRDRFIFYWYLRWNLCIYGSHRRSGNH